MIGSRFWGVGPIGSYESSPLVHPRWRLHFHQNMVGDARATPGIPAAPVTRKHQPCVFFGNTGLGFAGNQQLWPTEIPAMYFRRIRRVGDTWSTPKTLATPITRNMSPTYSLEIRGWGLQAISGSSQLKSQPCISGEYVRLMFWVGPPGVALV